jgi:hypothetical protein
MNIELTELHYPIHPESIYRVKLSDNKFELTDQLNELVASAEKVQSNCMKEWLCEKIDTGVNKLRSLGAYYEADTYEKIIENIKPKFWR